MAVSRIEEPTVLVLGAGASAAYGFPTGAQLLRKISETLIHHQNPVSQALHKDHHCRNDEMQLFGRQLQTAAEGSVDAFLEHRREFLQLGKLAIAYCLMPFEKPEKLFSRDNPQDWIRYLLGCMGGSAADFPRNALSVVTFNYDRSFEFAMTEYLRQRYNLTSEAARDLLFESIPIVHVHGQLDELQVGKEIYTRQSGRPYSEDSITPARIDASANAIRIVHESEDDPILEQARTLLYTAQNVCFLGFGYHQPNLRKLRIEGIEKPKLLGCGHGHTKRERDRINRGLARGIEFHGTVDATILDFLRQAPWV